MQYIISFKKSRTYLKLDDSALFRTQSYITDLCYVKFLPYLLIRWWNKLEWVMESFRTLLKLTRLDSTKSYLVIIGPNSYDKFTKKKNCMERSRHMCAYVGFRHNLSNNCWVIPCAWLLAKAPILHLYVGNVNLRLLVPEQQDISRWSTALNQTWYSHKSCLNDIIAFRSLC